MQKIEEWAVDSLRMEEFFRAQHDVAETPEGFMFRRCNITILRLPDRMLGGLHFPLTRIIFEGEADELESIYHRFFMRFVSAGG